jgi:hypothetical protein
MTTTHVVSHDELVSLYRVAGAASALASVLRQHGVPSVLEDNEPAGLAQRSARIEVVRYVAGALADVETALRRVKGTAVDNL